MFKDRRLFLFRVFLLGRVEGLELVLPQSVDCKEDPHLLDPSDISVRITKHPITKLVELIRDAPETLPIDLI